MESGYDTTISPVLLFERPQPERHWDGIYLSIFTRKAVMHIVQPISPVLLFVQNSKACIFPIIIECNAWNHMYSCTHTEFTRHFQTLRTRLCSASIAFQLYLRGPHNVTSHVWEWVAQTVQIRSVHSVSCGSHPHPHPAPSLRKF